IGASNVRRALGDGYTDALRSTWREVPESADFVMHWWQHAATLAARGSLQRFGLITTNSLRQTFNRRVLEPFLTDAKQPVSLLFATPDHQRVDSADGAAVRIDMTVGAAGSHEGRLFFVESESPTESDGVAVIFSERSGLLHADL